MPKEYVRTNDAGDKFYYKNPEMTIRHRTDGPAIEFSDGYRAWYVNGVLHRIDGPAVEHTVGSTPWYVNGVFIFSVNRDNDMLARMK